MALKYLGKFIVGMALLATAGAAWSAGKGLPLQRTAPEKYLDWSRLPFPPDEFQQRRNLLLARLKLAGGGVFLAPSRPARSQGDTFRQLNDFLYFTGLELPDSILALDSDSSRTIVFVPAVDPRFTSSSRPNDFPGRPLLGDGELRKVAGLEFGDIADFENRLADWVQSSRALWMNAGRAASEVPTPGYVRTWSPEELFRLELSKAHPTAQIRNAFQLIARLRMVKSEREIEALRRSVAITVAGIEETARFVKPGVSERALEGELEAAFKRRGAQRLAFASIIKSGPNSLWPWRVLASHYDRRNRAMAAGELVIFDVGCERDYYTSDIGRTFPVSGRFSRDQRRLVEMVRGVSDAVLREIRPGRTLADLQRAAVSKTPAQERAFMQTALFFGHHIGLDVGDPSLDDEPLKPGMVFTVEPWYYNHQRGVAVFVEDDVLVTDSGVENLSSGLARTAADLERLMSPPASKRPSAGGR